jgi:hypothetical protein
MMKICVINVRKKIEEISLQQFYLFYQSHCVICPAWKADMSELKYAWGWRVYNVFVIGSWQKAIPGGRQTRRDASHATAPAQRILKKAEAKA